MTEEQQILQQVEFYFSDSNLLNDRFLYTTQNANEGWVPIQTISQFERMKKFRPIDVIVDALRKSKELLEVSENGEMVRRKIPLSKNYNEIQQSINKRSVYVDNFPVCNSDNQEYQLDDLLAFFSKIHPVNQVRMKRGKDKKFHGACIVEFRSEQDAAAVVSASAGSDAASTGIVSPADSQQLLHVVAKSAYDLSKASKFAERRGRTKTKAKAKASASAKSPPAASSSSSHDHDHAAARERDLSPAAARTNASENAAATAKDRN